MLMRPDWDSYFMEIAGTVKKRSTCMRRQVGAVMVKERRILATGYNGAPQNLSHCSDVGCLRQKMGVPSGERHEICRGLHAEQNAIIQSALHGVTTRGSVIYTTDFPCSLCAKMLVNAGVVGIVAKQDYPDQLSEEVLAEAEITVRRYQDAAQDC